MKFHQGFAFTTVFTGLLATTLVPLLATAQNTASNVSEQVATPAAAQAASQYWTTERQRAAKPIDTTLAGSPKPVAVQSLSPSGPLVSAPGGSPQRSQTVQVQNAESVKPTASQQPLSYSYPFPYTRYFVGSKNYTNHPEATIGKVFFSKAGGGDFVCSASAVNSTNGRLIVTAGQCVSDGKGKFHRNVIFVPAYNPDNSSASLREPYGRWSACELFTRAAWHTKEDFSQDIGMIEACDRSGSKLHKVVGFLGFLANAPRSQHWHAIGYPQAAPFNGRKMTVCTASFATNDSGTPNPIGIGCDMTGGSSGGPWIVKYSPDTVGFANQINGVNSYKYNSQPGAMYSPYFGNEFLELRTFAISRGA